MPTPNRRNALTPDALSMMDIIARTGSFAAAAREMGRVPSALTYSVRQLEDALDVLLFDRRSRQARLTAAGQELLDEGRRLLAQMDQVAHRVRRVASGWESELTVAVDALIARPALFELIDAFYAVRRDDGSPPGTRLRLRSEVMTGLWEALVSGQADLAIGLAASVPSHPEIQTRPLGEVHFVFAVAPHHPLATATEPLTAQDILPHRAVALADSARNLQPTTVNLLPGQDVLTVSTMAAKVEAQLRGLGAGYLPECMVREHLQAGHLVAKALRQPAPTARVTIGWRAAQTPQPRRPAQGLALQWWLERLQSPVTRQALLHGHASPWPTLAAG
ncbi:MAG: LysR substrate-binding domain-containing protein [Aquabacterium sp.]